MYFKKTVKRKFRAGNKIKIFSCLFVISLLSFSIVSFDSAFAKPDELPRQARAQIPDYQSNEKPQFVSAMGKVQGKDLYVHIWVLVPHGVDKNEVVKQALAKHGAQPDFISQKFSTTGLYWDQFGDEDNGNDFVIQNYNDSNDPPGGLTALLNTHSTWNNVGTSSFVFNYGGITNRCPSLVPECYPFPDTHLFDGYNDVAWLPLTESNVLGVTWSGTSTDEADMAMNTNFSWFTNGDYVDIETVLLHENGHVAGLGHSTYGDAVMYPSYHGVLRFLQSDDIDGISALYPYFEPPTIVIYEDDMENETNGWTTTGATGLWHQSTNRANTQTTSWYYGDENQNPPDYDTGGANSGFLTSPVISLDGATSAALEFYEWSSMENGPEWDRTRIQASSNGVNWSTVGEFHETFNVWEKREVNLNSYAGGDVYLRFWFDTIDEQFNEFEGWYVDDVKVLVDNTNTIPNISPTANVGGPYTGTEGILIAFDGSGSSDSDGTIVQYDWDFGDSSTGTGVSPSHTYAAAGTYTVSLTVTDDDGATNTDTSGSVEVDPVANISPTANVGGPYTGTEGILIAFDGSGSSDSDGTIVQYDWDFGDSSTGTGVSPSHTYAAAGTYTVSLTVTDDDGATNTDTSGSVEVDPVANISPTANVGGPYTGTEGILIAFDGSGSSDSDGTIVQYDWDFGDSSTGTGVSPSHTYAAAGTYTVSLTVTDDDGDSSTADTVDINVADASVQNNPPTANAGADQNVDENSNVNLNGSASSDSDGTIATYAWTQTSGPNVALSDDTAQSPSFTAPDVKGKKAKVLVFELTVTDDLGASAIDTVTINVGNAPPPNNSPTANAGADQNVDENSNVNLNGSASSDSDGTIATYAWTQTSGPNVALSDDTAQSPSFTAPEVGAGGETLTFSLVVTDDDGDSSTTDTVDINVADSSVQNNPPTANAGADQNVDENSNVNLNGSASSDSDGTIATYAWTQTSGPNVALSDDTAQSPSFTAPDVKGKKAKVLVFELTVTDDLGASAIDTVEITVNRI